MTVNRSEDKEVAAVPVPTGQGLSRSGALAQDVPVSNEKAVWTPSELHGQSSSGASAPDGTETAAENQKKRKKKVPAHQGLPGFEGPVGVGLQFEESDAGLIVKALEWFATAWYKDLKTGACSGAQCLICR